jgi:hypothetical protein
MEPEVLVDLMEEIKEGFRLLTVEDFSEEELLDMIGQDIVEEDDVIDEEDEEFFKDTTESDIVCYANVVSIKLATKVVLCG